jgi:hypothetical protein
VLMTCIIGHVFEFYVKAGDRKESTSACNVLENLCD